MCLCIYIPTYFYTIIYFDVCLYKTSSHEYVYANMPISFVFNLCKNALV